MFHPVPTKKGTITSQSAVTSVSSLRRLSIQIYAALGITHAEAAAIHMGRKKKQKQIGHNIHSKNRQETLASPKYTLSRNAT